MKSKIAAVALVGFLGKAVQAVPSPSSLGSDLQILLHNDLYGLYTLPSEVDFSYTHTF